jgi:hypothetical protein
MLPHVYINIETKYPIYSIVDVKTGFALTAWSAPVSRGTTVTPVIFQRRDLVALHFLNFCFTGHIRTSTGRRLNDVVKLTRGHLVSTQIIVFLLSTFAYSLLWN